MIDADELIKTLESFMDLPDPGYAMGIGRAIWLVKDAPTLAPSNEPLTLEELRAMNGQPVWGKSLITDKPGEWFVLRVVEMSKTWFIACAGAEQGFGDKDTYGTTWLAYRRPPEEVRDDGKSKLD